MNSPTLLGSSNQRRRILRIAAGAAAGALAMGSAAWACTVADDTTTYFSSCAAPAGSTKACAPKLGYPNFPNATFIKGPSGSNIQARVDGPGLQPGTAYELRWVNANQLSQGLSCGSAGATKLSGAVISSVNGGISGTQGVIPANSPIGKGSVCFADAGSTTIEDSLPSIFKVTL